MTTAHLDYKRLAHRLYMLMMEANRRLTESERSEFAEPDIPDNDPELISALQFIRRKNVVARGQLNKYYQQEAELIIKQIENEFGNDEQGLINMLSNEPESEQLIILFRNFNSLSIRDKKQMLIDSKLLLIIQKLKEKKDDARRGS